jgi:hypothetical protein
VTIDFSGKFGTRNTGFSNMKGGYFSRVIEEVRFCEYEPQPPEVQQVLPGEDEFLCSLYILPVIACDQARKEIIRHFKEDKSRPAYFRGIDESSISGFALLSWRYQMGKTRLDHYLVFGKKFNYLFVSSPYGSNGSIESIIRTMRYR